MTTPAFTVAPCPPAWKVDAWVMVAYARTAAADRALAAHLLTCPACRRRAAMAWALLPDPACATMDVVPHPDLSFLSASIEP